MRAIAKTISVCILFLAGIPAFAADFEDGRIKMTIDKNNGRISLYYMTDVDKKKWEPLFWDRDKRTSFFAVYLNGHEYRLGENSRFRMYHRGTDTNPLLVFESQSLAITIQFSFIRTASSGLSNGIRIDMKIENWEEKTIEVGMRVLIDTFLGEKDTTHFRTDLRPISSETIIDLGMRDQWWVSRNKRYGLMGSIFVEGINPPNTLQFANWKRLYSATFRPEYVQTRSFSASPFSVRDSAVCYYLEEQPLEKWESRVFTILLAAEDKYGFDIDKLPPAPPMTEPDRLRDPAPVIIQSPPSEPSAPPVEKNSQQIAEGGSGSSNVNLNNTAIPLTGITRRSTILLPIGPIRVDLMTLRELIYKVDEYIYFGTPISEEELRGMELTITRLKSRYGGMINPLR